ncbi:hypothetical protein Goklo_007444 [Gossypium klotzschianum]|uniref:Uncharacterized protein n=1 Tax=Gossypium klotzschianum TaxID=34286 RepID=A0A7J8W2D8_9ROSI|nr:hypothetical protein [Gossypium klotzschianum]
MGCYKEEEKLVVSPKDLIVVNIDYDLCLVGIRAFTIPFDGRRWCFDKFAERSEQYVAGYLQNPREIRESGGQDGIPTTGVQNGVSR